MFPGSLDTLHTRWRQKAELFRQHGHEATARAYELCSSELEAALDAREDELLDLQEAAKASGYSPDHLGRLLREGRSLQVGSEPRNLRETIAETIAAASGKR